MNPNVSKPNTCVLLLTLLLLFLLTLCGCVDAPALPTEEKTIDLAVTVEDGDFFTAKTPAARVPYGGSFSVELTCEPGYTVGACSYEPCTIEYLPEQKARLTLHNLVYPTRVKVEPKVIDVGIDYQANGGAFLSGQDGPDHYTEWYTLTTHLRPNTSLGTNVLYRDGYTQIGWNTEADGSGEAVGLGSRFTVEKGTMGVLYAQWCKWLPEADFLYETTEAGKLRLTGYTGDTAADPFTVPAALHGVPVAEIAAGAFSQLSGTTLIFPDSLEKVEDQAFTDCSFTTLYLSDNIKEITDTSISAPLYTIHLNAVRPPQYLTNDNSEFTENVDRVMLNKDKNKLMFFAGCSFSYGLVSSMVEKVYGKDFVVLNLGVIGGGNAPIQLDCFIPYLHKGDVFIHAPEASQHQLMASYSCDFRLFIMTEGNYDLLAQTDAANLENFFSSLQAFNEARNKREKILDYSSTSPHYNDYGDITIARLYTGLSSVSYSDYTYFYRANAVNQEAIDKLGDWYKKLKATGCEVYLSFSPMNYDGLDTVEKKNAAYYFETFMKNNMGRFGVPVISQMKNYLFPSEYFYDSDYHMNEYGAEMRTEQLLKDLAAVLPVPEP